MTVLSMLSNRAESLGTLVSADPQNRLAVEVHAVTKKFESVLAVDELSIGIRDKNFVSIVGPSGCGKSTLLRMVAGLVAPSSGSIKVHGKPVTQPIQDASMVFQAPVLLPWRTTLSNILFVAEMRGENQRSYLDRARQLIEVAGLSGFEKSYPHELSGGMQQRVAICRALLMEPKLILMDEPFGALDIITRERMAFELQKIWSANRNTVIFVTHSVSEAVLLSDTVVVMTSRPGRISDVVEIDLPRPRNKETLVDKRFIELSTRVRNNIAAGWAE
jgi:NitT/TauT family transport system ATP-binding protein